MLTVTLRHLPKPRGTGFTCQRCRACCTRPLLVGSTAAPARSSVPWNPPCCGSSPCRCQKLKTLAFNRPMSCRIDSLMSAALCAGWADVSMMIQIQNKAVSWPRGTAASTAIPNSRSDSSNDCLDGKITTSYHWPKRSVWADFRNSRLCAEQASSTAKQRVNNIHSMTADSLCQQLMWGDSTVYRLCHHLSIRRAIPQDTTDQLKYMFSVQ